MADTNAPYENCKFELCDLPGQCKGEGKCHHPMKATPPADAALLTDGVCPHCAKIVGVDLAKRCASNIRDRLADADARSTFRGGE